MAPRKGKELNNVNETWQQNEENRRQEGQSGRVPPNDTSNVNNDLDQRVKEEAAEYDRTSQEDRLLGGERASVNDRAPHRDE